ncbi:MAG: glycoside hydrolase family 88 protein [Defluviitaleaceae bacterium]|nr:glycoside hydrolase family 88 protein [Defluviitaleaceae bacterium]
MYEILDRYIQRVLTESTPEAPIWNLEMIRQGKKPHWNYIDGCMMNSLLKLYNQTGDERYIKFIDEFMDFYINEDGLPLGFEIETYNLDNVCPGQSLFDLYKITSKEKYKKCIELLFKQLKEQPRTHENNFWHKQIYPNQVWLDGLYMAQVFNVRYGLENNKYECIDDMIKQFEIVRERMYIVEKGLYVHGYDASKSIFWANKETGRSANFWLRAMGWYSVALIDIIGLLPETDEHRKTLVSLLEEFLSEICKYQNEETGLYWQVVDKAGKEGNYLETSGSAMVAYAMLKGARLGVLPANFRDLGKKTFDGIYNKYMSESEDGLNLKGICLVAGLGPYDNLRRDGSYEYYISEPVVENDAKGVAPFFMCYTEIKLLVH